MASKKMTNLMSKLKKKAAAGGIVVKRPRISSTPVDIHYTGYITVCCGKAYLSEESYNRHAMREDEHSVNQWSDIIMKQPFVQIKKMSLTLTQRRKGDSLHPNKGRMALVNKHTLSKKFVFKKCNICKVVVHGSNLKRHMKNAHVLNGSHKCKYCACVYSSSRAVLLHSTLTHPQQHKKFYFNAKAQDKFVVAARNKMMKKSGDIPAGKKTGTDSVKKLPHKHSNTTELKQTKRDADIHECIFCGKILNSKLAFQHHLIVHIGDKPYSCQMCDEAFQTTNELTQHIKDLHPNSFKYFCEICPGLFYHTSEQLARHRKITHSGSSNSTLIDDNSDEDNESNEDDEVQDKPVGLKKMGGKVTSTVKSSDIIKMKSIKVDGGYKCPICGLILKELAYYRTHRITHTDIFPYQCTKCDAKFRTSGNCRSHMSSSHIEGGEFGCPLCPCVFGTGQGLKHHDWIYHTEKNKKSKLGGKFRNIHRNEIVSKAKKVKGFYIKNRKDLFQRQTEFPCDVCGKILKSKAAHSGHMLIHSNQFPVKCSKCGAKFRLPKGLDKHMQSSHVEDGMFNCSLCPCVFASLMGLRHHKRIYHTDNKYTWSRNKMANGVSNSTESEHSKIVSQYREATHSKKEKKLKPNKVDGGYECRTCGKFLKSILTYNGHMLIHLQQFPYKCDQCGVKFRLRSTLDRHVKTNHVENGEYQCYLCPCTFDLYRGLQRHLFCYHSGKRNTEGKQKLKKRQYKRKNIGKSVSGTRLSAASSSGEVKSVTEEYADMSNEYIMGQSIPKVSTEIVGEDDANSIQGIKMEDGYMCGLCGKILKNISCFKQHRLIHFDSAVHECPKCDQKFRTSSNRNAHLKRAHVKNGQFRCELCPCAFDKMMSLSSHINSLHPKE